MNWRWQPIAWVILGLILIAAGPYYTSMPRKLRIEYPGAMYHVMSRGDRQEKIFLDDVDRQDFLKTLAEACQETNWQVHAYCLMPNHYHLLPLGAGNPGTKPGGGDGVAAEHLHHSAQPSPPAFRARFERKI